jgi:hypothetical protein
MLQVLRGWAPYVGTMSQRYIPTPQKPCSWPAVQGTSWPGAEVLGDAEGSGGQGRGKALVRTAFLWLIKRWQTGSGNRVQRRKNPSCGCAGCAEEEWGTKMRVRVVRWCGRSISVKGCYISLAFLSQIIRAIGQCYI